MTGRRKIHGPRDRNARLTLLDGWWDRATVHAARVGVIGVGALGNEILKNLALLDFRTVLVVDPDTVEASNLSRSVLFRPRHEGMTKVDAAADTLADLNPDLAVTAVRADVMHQLGLGYLRELDVIIAGLDSRRVRWWLNRTARALGVPWVEGGTQGPHGHAVAFWPHEGPCYECSFTDRDWAAMDHVASCHQLVIDAAARGRVATSPTASSMVAAAQVHLAMDVLHRRPVVGGRSLLFNLEAPYTMVSGRLENPDCAAHYRYGEIIDSPLRASTATVCALVDTAVARVGEPATVELRWDCVWDLRCPGCHRTTPVRRPRGSVRLSEAACPDCGTHRMPSLVHRLTPQEHGDLVLAEVGIPPFDIVAVRGPTGQVWVELGGDRPAGDPARVG